MFEPSRIGKKFFVSATVHIPLFIRFLDCEPKLAEIKNSKACIADKTMESFQGEKLRKAI